ncbi:MAG TPA: PHP domain-containing protein [Peptococcaceae bacterium]|jgi:PHP family Zn ribbon phosphoesterase|nr:PHP domain-containing protein [Clostridia bacterium]HOB82247.1 PHP domain-containing protein [Peptococcaceae bacterium]HPZ70976.1 PHP domain-containing protein [Peptococcaceae bacterium]HQD54148.1 PHP domain-containing protein [Peptococcaceae bacterium]
MREWAMDLHIHTVLSPCAADDMLPSAVMGRAREAGLEILAITDHNSVENAAAFLEKGHEMGIKVFPGMELQTKEDIHLVCLFEQLENALQFQETVYAKLPPLKNKKEALGEQWLVDAHDQKVGEVERLLLVGAALTLEEAVASVHLLQGLCIASHLDRQAFSLWGYLGTIPPGLPLDGVELTPHLARDPAQLAKIKAEGFAYVVSSDAHYLSDLTTPRCFAYIKEATLAELKLALRHEEGRSIRTIR